MRAWTVSAAGKTPVDESEPVIESLVAADGTSLAPKLAEVGLSLAKLPNDLRERYRDTNATEVARHPAQRMLVVAGPGAGKSYLFLERIKHWLSMDKDALVYVASFVRKLVTDLQADVRKAELDERDKRRVTVTTLHHLARSLLERNKGTISHPRRAHIRVIAPPWHKTVWHDVLAFHSDCDPGTYTTKAFAAQFHTEEPWMRATGPQYARPTACAVSTTRLGSPT